MREEREGSAGGQAEKGVGFELFGAGGGRQAGGGQPCGGILAAVAQRGEGIGEGFAALAKRGVEEVCNRLPKCGGYQRRLMGAEEHRARMHGGPGEKTPGRDGAADGRRAPEAQQYGGGAVAALAGQRCEAFRRFLLHGAGEGAQRQA